MRDNVPFPSLLLIFKYFQIVLHLGWIFTLFAERLIFKATRNIVPVLQTFSAFYEHILFIGIFILNTFNTFLLIVSSMKIPFAAWGLYRFILVSYVQFIEGKDVHRHKINIPESGME